MLCEKRCQSMGYHGYVNNPPLKFPARKIKTGTVFAEFSGRRLKSIFLKCLINSRAKRGFFVVEKIKNFVNFHTKKLKILQIFKIENFDSRFKLIVADRDQNFGGHSK